MSALLSVQELHTTTPSIVEQWPRIETILQFNGNPTKIAHKLEYGVKTEILYEHFDSYDDISIYIV